MVNKKLKQKNKEKKIFRTNNILKERKNIFEKSLKIKTLLLGLLMVFTFSFGQNFILSANAQVYISQVLYYPDGTSTGGEALELYNAGDETVDLSGYRLDTTTREFDAVIPEGYSIRPNSYFLIADTGWYEKRDNLSFPLADFENAITLRINDGGVALIDSNDIIKDAVGWGNPENIGEKYFSGQPSQGTSRGNSLKRVDFTGNNLNDFVEVYPELRNSTTYLTSSGSNIIEIFLNVLDADSFIHNISVEKDLEDGIILLPGEDKEVKVSFYVSKDKDYELAVHFKDSEMIVEEVESSSQELKKYEATLLLPYYTEHGNNSVKVELIYEEGILEKEINISVLPLLSFSFSIPSVNCEVLKNQECKIIGDTDPESNSPTIQNQGNTVLDFIVKSESNADVEEIPLSLITYSFDYMPINELSPEPVLNNVRMEPGINSYLPFSLGISAILEKGSYSTKVVLIGVSDEV